MATALAGGVTTLPGHDVPYKLPPSLGNYFKQELIPHVLGWPTETIERQVISRTSSSSLNLQQLIQIDLVSYRRITIRATLTRGVMCTARKCHAS